jgi:TolA-binding protein
MMASTGSVHDVVKELSDKIDDMQRTILLEMNQRLKRVYENTEETKTDIKELQEDVKTIKEENASIRSSGLLNTSSSTLSSKSNILKLNFPSPNNMFSKNDLVTFLETLSVPDIIQNIEPEYREFYNMLRYAS